MHLQIFQIIIFIFSAVIHEYMHGWMANQLGDSTARDQGRLTMNPLVHLDPFGSVIMPLVLIMFGSPFVFGYAKPVPFNPYKLRDRKYGGAKVALAGPLGNFIVALFFGFLLRFFPVSAMMSGLFQMIIIINLVLMVFNLIPIPPLDGSKIIEPFLPYKWQEAMIRMEPYGISIVLMLLMFSGLNFIYPIIDFLFGLIVGR